MKLDKVYYDPQFPAGRITENGFQSDGSRGKVVFWDKRTALSPYKFFSGEFTIKEPTNSKVAFLIPISVKEHVNITYSFENGEIVKFRNRVEGEKIPATPESFKALSSELDKHTYQKADEYVYQNFVSESDINLVSQEIIGYSHGGNPVEKWHDVRDYTRFSDVVNKTPAIKGRSGELLVVTLNEEGVPFKTQAEHAAWEKEVAEKEANKLASYTQGDISQKEFNGGELNLKTHQVFPVKFLRCEGSTAVLKNQDPGTFSGIPETFKMPVHPKFWLLYCSGIEPKEDNIDAKWGTIFRLKYELPNGKIVFANCGHFDGTKQKKGIPSMSFDRDGDVAYFDSNTQHDFRHKAEFNEDDLNIIRELFLNINVKQG